MVRSEVSLSEAIDNLEVLSELEPSDHLELVGRHQLVRSCEGEGSHQLKLNPRLLETIKESFRTLLRYLKDYQQRHEDEKDQQAQGIRTMMVLAGRAADHLDRCTALFRRGVAKGKVQQWPEFCDLFHFYRTTVLLSNSEDFSTEAWGVEKEVWEGEDIGAEHDEETLRLHGLEAIKQDSEYELFYMKKDSGVPFCDAGLFSNIKMACDLVALHGEYVADDPLLQVKSWQDKSWYVAALGIYGAIKPYLQGFLKEAGQQARHGLIGTLHSALLALMLAKNGENLLRKLSIKCCYRYFNDFLYFFRKALDSPEYYDLTRKDESSYSPLEMSMMYLIDALAQNLYKHLPGRKELAENIEKMTGGCPSATSCAAYFSSCYEALQGVLSHHPSGPLFKALDLFRDHPPEAFDPLLQDNLPHRLYELVIEDLAVAQLYLPSPTIQEDVLHARVCKEFLAFLHSYARQGGGKRHLLINLQDRTRLPAFSRAHALEELQREVAFADQLVVVTLAKEGAFYYQEPPYHVLDDAAEFMKTFKAQLSEEGTGYWFPKGMQGLQEGAFLEGLLVAVHELLFDKRARLSRKERLDFIECVNLLMMLKCLELSKASSFSLTCKDGLDVSLTMSVELWVLLAWLQGHALEAGEYQQMKTLLFSSSLMVRERSILPERFQRMVSWIERLESRGLLGDKKAAKRAETLLGGLFSSKTLDFSLHLPVAEEG